MKTKIIRLSMFTVMYLFVSIQLSAQQNASVDPVAEIMGMFLLAPHTESTPQNTFKFQNSTPYKITFTYKGKQISVNPGSYSEVFTGSRPFTGSIPLSFYENLRIDDHPPANYRQFESSRKNIVDLSQQNNVLIHRSESEAQLKQAITDCENIIQQIQQHKNSTQVSHKFIEPKLYSMDMTIESLNGYIKSAKIKLEQIERNANKIDVNVVGTTSSTKTAQNTTTQQSGSTVQQSDPERAQQNQSTSQSTDVATAAERKADEERVLQIIRQQQAETARKQQNINQAATEIGNMVGQAIAADQRYKEEAYERQLAYQRKNEIEAQAIIQVYEKKARLGDEAAIAQMIRANKLLNGGNEVKYMNDMIQLHKSPVATSSLINHYEGVVDTYKRKSRSGIAKTVGAAVITTGAIVGLTSWANSIDIYEEPDRESEYDALQYLTIGAAVGGVMWTIAKGIGIVRPLQEDEYLNAKSILKSMKATVTFYPNYDIRTKTIQLALRASF